MRQAAGVPWTVVIARQSMIVKALWRYHAINPSELRNPS
jgi:hypothetical protein